MSQTATMPKKTLREMEAEMAEIERAIQTEKRSKAKKVSETQDQALEATVLPKMTIREMEKALLKARRAENEKNLTENQKMIVELVIQMVMTPLKIIAAVVIVAVGAMVGCAAIAMSFRPKS